MAVTTGKQLSNFAMAISGSGSSQSKCQWKKQCFWVIIYFRTIQFPDLPNFSLSGLIQQLYPCQKKSGFKTYLPGPASFILRSINSVLIWMKQVSFTPSSPNPKYLHGSVRAEPSR